jgi:hypothetical protein
MPPVPVVLTTGYKEQDYTSFRKNRGEISEKCRVAGKSWRRVSRNGAGVISGRIE